MAALERLLVAKKLVSSQAHTRFGSTELRFLIHRLRLPMNSNRTDLKKAAAASSAMHRKVLATLVLAGTMTLAACGGGGDFSSPANAVADKQVSASEVAAASSADAASLPTATMVAANTTLRTNVTTVTGSLGTADTSMTGVLLDTSFGVKGDGVTNDRAALQAGIDGSVGRILLITGKSRIDTTGLTLHSNSHIRFAKGSSIKLLRHNTDSYQMMRVWDVSNVVIEAPFLDGSKELNSATSGEWGMSISIAGASNVTITSPTMVACWGDGIYIANSYSGSGAVSKSITINNHLSDGCRRQGATITSGNGITFNNQVWQNTKGTYPQAGLDIEPDNNSAVLRAIRTVSPTTLNNAGPGIRCISVRWQVRWRRS